MIEIKFTLDATPALLCTLQDIAGALRAAARPVTPLSPSNHNGPLTSPDRPAELREGIEKDGAAEKTQNLTAEAPSVAERPETPENVEGPKKRKPRAKKSPSESGTPVSPAIGDNLSPAAEADHEQAKQEETNAPETATDTEPTVAHAEGTDPLAGKGQTGEILAVLTRKAIGDLDALGVDRGDANRRIRDYCASHEIKFATFPALLQAVGYAEAIAVCEGA